MQKIGIIFTSYGMQDYLSDSLYPWIIARKNEWVNYQWYISAVSTKFKGYEDIEQKSDKTVEILKNCKENNEIDFLFTSDEYLTEAHARNEALKPLLAAGCNYIWIVDGDEFYTLSDIENILYTVHVEPFVSFFKLSLKNYIFNKNTFLLDPFQPSRIWKTETNGYKLLECNYDNDFIYGGTIVKGNKFNNVKVQDRYLPVKIISPHVAWIKHYSWLNNDQSKKKIQYQTARGWECSYQWNNDKNCVEFNTDYYRKNNLAIPQTGQE